MDGPRYGPFVGGMLIHWWIAGMILDLYQPFDVLILFRPGKLTMR